MNIKNWLAAGAKKLEVAGITTARLDCLVLLEDAIRKDRSYILAHSEDELSEKQIDRLNLLIERRKNHEPLAYIRGKTEFYGREFIVTPDTLEPRPETETMIELLKQLMEDGRWKVEDRTLAIDIGTGSGALAITIKLEVPNLTVLATDISEECLRVAQKNAKKLVAEVKFYQGNLLDAMPPSTLHLPPSRLAILANLPYVPDSHRLNQAAMHEPKIAIFGGADGLDLYRTMFYQISVLDHKPGYILTESLPPQHVELANIAKNSGYKLMKTDDFIQVFSLF